jgi:DNA replication protein DnaC
MTDSERLNAGLNRAARRRTAAPHLVGPIALDAVAELARKHMRQPENFRFATDAELAAKDEADRLADLKAKADIMLSRLPSLYRSANYVSSPEGRQGADWVRAYRAGDRSSLVILGTPGTGKTWLAAAIARDLMTGGDRPVPVTFVTVADMLDALRGARPGLDVDMLMFSAAPVLVLDDLGLENHTDWTREQLYRLSHARSHNGRPTIVTSNLDGPEIKNTYETRTVQRLFGGAKLIELAGESLRDLPF